MPTTTASWRCPAEADWALEQSAARIAKEDETRVRLAAGELGLDLYGLRAKLAELGVAYVEDWGE